MTTAEQQDLLAALGDLADDAVQRILRENPPERDLRFKFETFHQENPGVYAALVSLARQLKASGHRHLGIKMLWEVLRFQTLVGDVKTTDGYRLNNSYTAFFARLIMESETDLEGAFETRRATADD